MRPIVRQQAMIVDDEVGVVERGVDVRVELTSRRLERAVVVAFKARPQVAGEELVVVAKALFCMELNALEGSLCGGRDHRPSVVEARLPTDTAAGVGNKVLAGRRDEHVLDDISQLAIRALDSDFEVGGDFVVVPSKELVDVLPLQFGINGFGAAAENALTARSSRVLEVVGGIGTEVIAEAN